MNFDEVLRLGALGARLSNIPDENLAELNEVGNAYSAGLQQLPREAVPCVVLAMKLLQGKPYRITTDNKESVARYRKVAERLGATVETADETDFPAPGMTCIVFRPPLSQ
jgi:hypothetical protein